MNEQELKPCPFCGGEAKLMDSMIGPKLNGWLVTCGAEQCDIGPSAVVTRKEKAIAAWNARPGEDAFAAEAVAAERARIVAGLYDAAEECVESPDWPSYLIGFIAGYTDKVLNLVKGGAA